MVDSSYTYAIDSSFLFEKAIYDFYKVDVFYHNNEDITYLFGFLTNFLKIINSLNAQNGVLIIGNEVSTLLETEKLNIIIKLLDKLEISVIKDFSRTSIDICSDLSKKKLCIITKNKNMNLFLCKDIDVIIIDSSNNFIYYSLNNLKTHFDIEIEFLNTYIVLSNKFEGFSLKKSQVIRLIDLYGSLDEILNNVLKLPSRIRKMFINNQLKLSSLFNYLESITNKGENQNIQIELLIKNIMVTKENIINLGFPSLVRYFDKTERKLFTNDSNNKIENEKQVIINNIEGLNLLKIKFSSEEFVAIDTETDDKDPRKAKLLGISLSFIDNEAYFIPFLQEDLKDITPKDIVCFFKENEQHNIKIIGHNIKYDILVLLKHSISLNNIYFDTMIASNECYGDLDFLNLKYLVKKFLNVNIKSYNDIVNKEKSFLDLPFKALVNHACDDAVYTLKLFYYLNNELLKRELQKQFFDQAMPLVKKFVMYEYNGIQVSYKKLVKLKENLILNIIELKKLIFSEIGEAFNIDNNKDLKTILFKKFGYDQLLSCKHINIHTLESLSLNNSVVRNIVFYKRSNKQINNIESIIKSSKNLKIFPVFNLISSNCGFVSSSSPDIFKLSNIDLFLNSMPLYLQIYFLNSKKALKKLQNISNELQNWNQIKAHICEKISNKVPSIDITDFLLKYITGYSEFRLIHFFMIDILKLNENAAM